MMLPRLPAARFVIAALALAAASPALAGWALMSKGAPVQVAKSTLTVTPTVDWNRASARPAPKGESWTLNGPALDRIDFLAAIESGEALARERNKKDRPLPRFRVKMLAPDIAAFYEETQRIALGTPDFQIDAIEPVLFLASPGFLMRFHYTLPGENLLRKGEARAAIVGSKLYLISYAAAAIHYFDSGLPAARAVMDGARL